MMETELKNKLRVALAPAIYRATIRFWDNDNMPSMSDELIAQMTEAALIPLFACSDMEQYQRDNGLLK